MGTIDDDDEHEACILLTMERYHMYEHVTLFTYLTYMQMRAHPDVQAYTCKHADELLAV